MSTTTNDKPTWAEIHETARTFFEGLGDAGQHDLVSLERIETRPCLPLSEKL